MDDEIRDFLLRHLRSVQENDVATYRETSAEDLTLYEWWITPHRIDGLSFHEFMMGSNAATRHSLRIGREAKGGITPGPGEPAHPALRRHGHSQLHPVDQHGTARGSASQIP